MAPRPVMTVLGDTFSAESEASAGPEWPQILGDRLDWEVRTDAVDGSGCLSAGAGDPFGARVPAVLSSPSDVIVVAGGPRDFGEYPVKRITKAAEKVVTQLVEQAPDAEVILVSPCSSGQPGPLTTELSVNLQRVTQEKDVEYVDATGWLPSGEGLVAADGLHSTDAGQERLPQEMEQALEQLGLVS